MRSAKSKVFPFSSIASIILLLFPSVRMSSVEACANARYLSYRRHLIRLWLRDPELAWETPATLQSRWDRLYKDITPQEQYLALEEGVHRVRGA